MNKETKYYLETILMELEFIMDRIHTDNEVMIIGNIKETFLTEEMVKEYSCTYIDRLLDEMKEGERNLVNTLDVNWNLLEVQLASKIKDNVIVVSPEIYNRIHENSN